MAPAADDRARRGPDRACISSDPGSPCARSSSRWPRTSGSTRCWRSPRGRRRSRCRSGSRAPRSSPRTWSRWGSTPRRSRSRRSARLSPAASTGSTTCSRRCCSLPRWSARRCSAAPASRVAALAFVTIGGNRFGADGGGIVVLAAAYLGPAGCACAGAARRSAWCSAVAAAAVAVVLLLLAFDAATGGSSHVTDAIGDGPVALARDIADRIELVRAPHGGECGRDRSRARLARDPRRDRACAARRDAVLDAFLVGLAVSLLVNDTPSDVLGMGAAIAVVLARDPRSSDVPLRLPPMRRALPASRPARPVARRSPAAAAARKSRRRPRRSSGRFRRRRRRRRPGARRRRSRATRSTGESVFASAGCGGCHTLEAAGTRGTVGPNLDDAKPDSSSSSTASRTAPARCPRSRASSSEQQIADVAAYVVEATSG